ncbi:MAG: alpha-E domain-containing protein [Actinobacteria bacterium]|nr:alpha-E domain-containing protein [Actinomycetota bacterium]
MLLSRTADNIYWGARYMERADDTARVVRSFTEVLLDLPTGVASSWEPLLAVIGSRELFDEGHVRANESDIVRFLVADTANPGSVVSSVAHARENLRTTREVLPRDAWQTVNDLFLYTGRDAESGVDRRSRARFLSRVVSEHQRLDGVISGAMQRDEAYEIWRLGQALERADMTTRVLGVRAAALLAAPDTVDDYDEVQWMGVLRSLTALQMYQRATRGPIVGSGVVAFLLFDRQFPRSVAGCLERIKSSLSRLPNPDITAPAVEAIEQSLVSVRADAGDGAALDAAMDEVQLALAVLNDAVFDAFMRAGE